ETAATQSAEGKTDIYAVTIGLDGFHGVSPTGSKVINSYMPDLSKPGAVKDGEVELVAGVALKNTNKAGVLRGIKISPIKDLSNNKIIKIKDKERIEKLLGYPDKFELVEEVKSKKTEAKEK
ncbi:MAG: hypothetical protein MSA15_13125, partial [Clostridium sp.]|nr:hypothetical protein [Clostridium sp.]